MNILNWDFFSFPELTLEKFSDVALMIAALGILGIISNKKNLLMSVISIEMMYYGLNLMFLIASLYLDDIYGEAIAIFVLTLAGAESALALALITTYYKTHFTIEINEL